MNSFAFTMPRKEHDNFISIPITSANIDRWIVRSTIRDFIRTRYPQMKGRLLDVGCGRMPYRAEILDRTLIAEYIGLDINDALMYEKGIKPDFTWDGIKMPFEEDQFDCALATEVFEHVPDIEALLLEIRRVIKPGGTLHFTTPFFWPYHEVPHDRQRWTAHGLRLRLEQAGFREITIEGHGNWHSSLAQFLGLWVKRAPMNKGLRRMIRPFVLQIQKFLMRWDANSTEKNDEMPRTIAGTAIK
jgi:SAM-dependent methyltransferase